MCILPLRWLPLHWALSRDRPNAELLFLLVSAYPEGLFDPDYQDQLPYDKYAYFMRGFFIFHVSIRDSALKLPAA